MMEYFKFKLLVLKISSPLYKNDVKCFKTASIRGLNVPAC